MNTKIKIILTTILLWTASMGLAQEKYSKCPEYKYGIDSLNTIIQKIIPDSVLTKSHPIRINFEIDYGQFAITSLSYYINEQQIVYKGNSLPSAFDFQIPDYDFSEISLRYIYPYYYATCDFKQVDTDYDDGFMTLSEASVAYFQPWADVNLDEVFFNHREVDSLILFVGGWDSARGILQRSISNHKNTELLVVNFHLFRDGTLSEYSSGSADDSLEEFSHQQLEVIDCLKAHSELFTPAILRGEPVNSVFAVFIRKGKITFIPMEKMGLY